MLLDKANTVLEQVKKPKDIAKVPQQNGLKLDATGWFARSAPQIPKVGELVELRGAAIDVTAQKPIADRVYTQKDAAYLFALKDTQAADMERFSKDKDTLMKQALAETPQRVAQKFIETLKANANVKVNSGSLDESQPS